MKDQVIQKLFSQLPAIEAWRTYINTQDRCLEQIFATVAQRRSMVVRVLLSSCALNDKCTWIFKSDQGLVLSFFDENNTVASKKIMCREKVVVRVVDGHIVCRGKKIRHGMRIQPLQGHVEHDGIAYDGEFCVVPHKQSIMCINHVDLERYIEAVLKTESWPGWPLEVNKVFAIACRSYVAAQALEGKKSLRPFHVKNSNVHQTYRGKHDIAVLKQAVKQTQGVVLGYDNKPILAMFDCCCGGIIPAHATDINFSKAPYLARSYACTYCKNCSLYSWVVSYGHKQFHDLCGHHKKDIKVIRDIAVKKDQAGLVTEVVLQGNSSQVTVPGKTFYALLKEVKSFSFDIKKTADAYVFSGGGYGHHKGLCQWGARQMVREGWDYQSILRFYYPQTHFMRLM